MNLPTKKECESLLDKYNVPDNIRKHMNQVTRIAVFLSKKFNEAGIKVNTVLVERAGLIHDIAKHKYFEDKSVVHEDLGEEIIKKEGYPKVANLVKKHAFKYLFGSQLKTWEEKIIKYSDLRVMHDKIVLLNERFDDLNKRYSCISEKSDEGRNEAFKLEKEIFSIIHLKPEDLKTDIEKIEEELK